MRIDHLYVHNFRCFEEKSFYFHPNFNVLIGENGSGKTAVLEAMVIAIGSWFLGIKGQSSVGIKAKDIRIAGHAYDGELTFEEQYPVEISTVGFIGENNPREKWVRALHGVGGRTTSREARSIRQLASAAAAAARSGEEITLPVLAYYGTARLWLKPRESRRYVDKEPDRRELSRLAAYRGCIDHRLDPREFVRWMERQDRLSYHERRDPALYRTVRKAATNLIEYAIDVRYDARSADVVVIFGDREPLPFSYLSDGQRTMLALVGVSAGS